MAKCGDASIAALDRVALGPRDPGSRPQRALRRTSVQAIIITWPPVARTRVITMACALRRIGAGGECAGRNYHLATLEKDPSENSHVYTPMQPSVQAVIIIWQPASCARVKTMACALRRIGAR